MTALARQRMSTMERWTHRQFPLAITYKAFKNGSAVIDLATGKIRPGAAGAGLLAIGKFDEDIDATSVEKLVQVNLGLEIEVERWTNDTVAPVTIAMRGQLCYILDDQTVTSSPTGASIAGRVWDVDSTLGVAVQRIPGPQSLIGIGDAIGTAPAWATNDLIIPTGTAGGQIFDIPTTTGASTVTLPASAKEGAVLKFAADGTKNAHTVQYRDATGPVNLTTALTASKRHLVIAAYLGGKWHANAYISP